MHFRKSHLCNFSCSTNYYTKMKRSNAVSIH